MTPTTGRTLADVLKESAFPIPLITPIPVSPQDDPKEFTGRVIDGLNPQLDNLISATVNLLNDWGGNPDTTGSQDDADVATTIASLLLIQSHTDMGIVPDMATLLAMAIVRLANIRATGDVEGVR